MSIIAFCGLQGSGKTTLLMRYVVQRFRQEACQVYSDMVGIRVPGVVYIDPEHPIQLATMSEGVFAFDEAQNVCDSRFWVKVPAEVLASWSQLRKNGMDVCYTTQLFEAVDSRLRGNTTHVYNCHRAGRFFLIRRVFPGTKKVIGVARPYPISRKVWAMYNTHEIVGKKVGQGAGKAEFLADERRRRAERAAAAGFGKSAQSKNPFDVSAYDSKGQYTHSAIEARRFLMEDRVYHHLKGEPLASEIERELRRRAWLRYCRLRHDRVPGYITYENPWLHGWSPAAVKARVLAQQEQDAEEGIIERDNKRRARK